MVEKPPRRKAGPKPPSSPDIRAKARTKVPARAGRSRAAKYDNGEDIDRPQTEPGTVSQKPASKSRRAGSRPASRAKAAPKARDKGATASEAPNAAEKSLILLERRAKAAGALLAAAERALELELRQKEGNARITDRPAATAKRVQRLRAELERRLDRLLAAEHPQGVAGGADGPPD